jgi:hypothetical protein
MRFVKTKAPELHAPGFCSIRSGGLGRFRLGTRRVEKLTEMTALYISVWVHRGTSATIRLLFCASVMWLTHLCPFLLQSPVLRSTMSTWHRGGRHGTQTNKVRACLRDGPRVGSNHPSDDDGRKSLRYSERVNCTNSVEANDLPASTPEFVLKSTSISDRHFDLARRMEMPRPASTTACLAQTVHGACQPAQYRVNRVNLIFDRLWLAAPRAVAPRTALCAKKDPRILRPPRPAPRQS